MGLKLLKPTLWNFNLTKSLANIKQWVKTSLCTYE